MIKLHSLITKTIQLSKKKRFKHCNIWGKQYNRDIGEILKLQNQENYKKNVFLFTKIKFNMLTPALGCLEILKLATIVVLYAVDLKLY